jgi:peptidoglycan-associated lipoprotein
MSGNTIVRSTVLLASVLAFGLAGCQTTTDADTEQTDSQSTGSEFSEGGPSDSSDGGGSITSLETVYFDYDRSEIRSDARTALQSNATAIQGNDAWGVVTVEGHCDERGSEEYNLALGDRRANTVRRYLVDLGVSSSRLRTVSFGEAKPAVQGHNESAWRYNRRSEFASGS